MKKPKTYRLDQGIINLIELLSSKLGETNTDVIEFSIRQLANKELSKDEIINAFWTTNDFKD